MTFASQETSRTLGEPIGLLLFRYGDGDGDVFAYTDAEAPISYSGITFQPLPNDKDSTVASGSLDRTTIDIRLPQDCEVVRLYDFYPPSSVILVSAYEGHVDNTEFKLIWSGRVLGLKTEGMQTSLTCEPISTSMMRSGLRRKYQYGCPHVLYGPACRADKAAATVNETVIAVSGPILTLNNGWAGSQGAKYLNGLATWITPSGRVEVRSVIRIMDAQNVLLSGNIVGLNPGDNVDLTLGCNHQMGDCGDLHNNLPNFGGQPWIPLKNPIGVTNNFV